MSNYPLSEEVLHLIQELIINISSFKDDTDIFKHINKHIVESIQNADSMFYINHKDIDRTIGSLSDKFMFHGFLRESGDLLRLYDKVLCKNLHKDEIQNRLNVMKLLLSLSESPTNYLASVPEGHVTYKVEEEPEIDWASYLKEGIERWSPPPDTESDGWTSDDSTADLSETKEVSTNSSIFFSALGPKSSIPATVKPPSYQEIKSSLRNSVQNHWFNTDHVQLLPESQHPEATIATRWHHFLCKTTKGLLVIKEPCIVSEYKIIREVIWQLWEPHDSFAFQLVGDKLMPRDNRTIASLRPQKMKEFLTVFSPYIEIMQTFRDFERNVRLKGFSGAPCDIIPPNTYQSYCFALNEIFEPTLRALVDLELTISKQDSKMTLLQLSGVFKENFTTLCILNDIHKRVVLDYEQDSGVMCSVNLLVGLHKGLVNSINKDEQDIYLCLYLQSLFKYMSLIDHWLGKNEFRDSRNEFVIYDQNYYEDNSAHRSGAEKRQLDWQMIYQVKQLPDHLKDDGILQIICTQVLEHGQNIYILSLLGKLHLLESNEEFDSVSLYDNLVNSVLNEISKYFPDDNATENRPSTSDGTESYAEPGAVSAICKDYCKFPTEMDKLENLVDTTDGFLMAAFSGFFMPTTAKENKEAAMKPEETLYQRIKKTTKNLFPCVNLVEDVFSTILSERYSASGLLVKNILTNDYQLEKHLDLLKRVFLFEDDLIFPFYRRIFEKMDTKASWQNTLWLTSHLQDIFMDLHPEQYQHLTVLAKDDWVTTWKDPLKACTNFKIQYKLQWPANIVIRTEHLQKYKEMFIFILQIKWALYTLNHLHFSDIESKKLKRKKDHKSLKILQSRLRVLRFCLINEFSSIQHYILGYIFMMYKLELTQELEKSCDLDSLISSHSNFITNIHKDSTYLRDFNSTSHGFNLLLYLVRKLSIMWKNMREISDADLDKNEKSYKKCHNALFQIVNPRDLF